MASGLSIAAKQKLTTAQQIANGTHPFLEAMRRHAFSIMADPKILPRYVALDIIIKGITKSCEDNPGNLTKLTELADQFDKTKDNESILNSKEFSPIYRRINSNNHILQTFANINPSQKTSQPQTSSGFLNFLSSSESFEGFTFATNANGVANGVIAYIDNPTNHPVRDAYLLCIFKGIKLMLTENYIPGPDNSYNPQLILDCIRIIPHRGRFAVEIPADKFDKLARNIEHLGYHISHLEQAAHKAYTIRCSKGSEGFNIEAHIKEFLDYLGTGTEKEAAVRKTTGADTATTKVAAGAGAKVALEQGPTTYHTTLATAVKQR